MDAPRISGDERSAWLSTFSRVMKASMHQLLRANEDETVGMPSMKWETFLKLMRGMGFTYDPSIPGSTVRFDPPNPNDVSITFHTPHPDPIIHPTMLREFVKKLAKTYGWISADFVLSKTSEAEANVESSTWFSRLTKETTENMHQLLRTAEDETKGMSSMKWETFLQLMRELGFTCDPSTAGSSVRFDPPNPDDVSITFHKPHPDPTLHPMLLRTFVKKLKNTYGWNEADFNQMLPKTSRDESDVNLSVSLLPLKQTTSHEPEVTEAPAATAAPSSPAPPTKKPTLKSSVSNLAAQMSSVSLLPAEQTTAQSARSYLKEQHLLEAKAKVKSRSEVSLPVVFEKGKKKVFMSEFSLGRSKEKSDEPKRPRNPWFSRLTKKTTTSMHELLRASEDETMGLASMKWEAFLKIMREMGFTYDPSTPGSSVRFDPPDPKDVSITFHKPHPDPTIHPVMLREFAKKLKKNYGWSEAEFLPPSNDAARGMYWSTIVKLMQEKGFVYDHSVGSSARFDPPDQNDMSMTFYKPPPDAPIHPLVLEEFVKKLEKTYVQMDTQFLRV